MAEMDEEDSSPAARSPDTRLVPTKLLIPRARQRLVPRDRLVVRLDEAINRKLILVSAPAGFGKTTLVSTWASRVRLPVAWLSLRM